MPRLFVRPTCCCIVSPTLLLDLADHPELEDHHQEAYAHTHAHTMELRALAAASVPDVPRPPRITAAEELVHQRIHDCGSGRELPGTVLAGPFAEGTAMQAVSQTTARVTDFWRETIARHSLDDHGMELISSINYGQNFRNAFWNGTQMVYGTGDGLMFGEFWHAEDVIAHELTHGMTQHASGLDFHGEPGSINEHLSDVFAATFLQWREQAPASADALWQLGGAALGTRARERGYTCLRDMLHPGGRHCMGAQPAHYHPFDPNAEPHDNSGICNNAFATFARTFGGNAYEVPLRVWYAATLDDRISRVATIREFAASTIATAEEWTEATRPALIAAVRAGWQAAGVPLDA